MSKNEEEIVEQAADQEVVEAEVEESPEDLQHKLNSTVGRLSKEERRASNMQAYLAQYGIQTDDDGNPITPPANQQQSAATGGYVPPPPPEEPDLYDPVQLQNYIQQEAGKMFGVIAPLLNESVEAAVSSKNPEWGEIKEPVMQILRTGGFQSVVHAKATNPVFFDLAVRLAKAEKANATVALDPAAEAARQTRIAAAAGAGGGTSAVNTGKDYGFSPEELTQLTAMGMTPEQADKIYNEGKAVVQLGEGE